MPDFTYNGLQYTVHEDVEFCGGRAVLDDGSRTVVQLSIVVDPSTGENVYEVTQEIEHEYTDKSASFIGTHLYACIAAPVKPTAKFERGRSQLGGY